MKPNACAVALSVVLLCGSVPSAPAATRHDPADPGVPPAAPATEVDDANAGRPAQADGPAGMVIVTDATLVPAFRRLADAHGRLGLTTRVRTLQAIRDAYPAGRDDAERIRLFLKDARADWGIDFALMGGDEPLIPMRRAYVDGLPHVLEPPVVLLPTDQYYACLDGDWNADGDDRWGELPNPVTGDPGDDADVIPELCVGRAPVTTRQQAQDFVNKTLQTLSRPAVTDPFDVLLAAGTAFGSIFFAPEAEAAKADIESATDASTTRLYEDAASWPGALPLTESSLLAGLETGPEIAMLFGSGGSGTFALDSDALDLVQAADLLGLENRDSFSHTVVLSAYTTTPGILSIGGALVLAKRGGSASVLGPTDVEFVAVSQAYIERYLEQGLVEHAATIGEALRAGVRDPVSALTTGYARLTYFGNTLLGDPALPFPVGPQPAHLAARLSRPDPAGALAIGGLDPRPTGLLGVARRSLAVPSSPAGTTRASARMGRASSTLEIQFEVQGRGDGQTLDVAVLDLAGRRLRQLARATARAGSNSMTWDMRDDDGRRVNPGLYFVRIAAGADQQVIRAVVW